MLLEEDALSNFLQRLASPTSLHEGPAERGQRYAEKPFNARSGVADSVDAATNGRPRLQLEQIKVPWGEVEPYR